MLRHQAPRCVLPPRLFQDLPERRRRDVGQTYEHGRITPIVVRGEEGLWIGLHPEVALLITALDHQDFTVLPQAGQKLAPDPEPRGAVGQPFLDARKTQGESADSGKRYSRVLRHESQ